MQSLAAWYHQLRQQGQGKSTPQKGARGAGETLASPLQRMGLQSPTPQARRLSGASAASSLALNMRKVQPSWCLLMLLLIPAANDSCCSHRAIARAAGQVSCWHSPVQSADTAC